MLFACVIRDGGAGVKPGSALSGSFSALLGTRSLLLERGFAGSGVAGRGLSGILERDASLDFVGEGSNSFCLLAERDLGTEVCSNKANLGFFTCLLFCLFLG